jgi:hypothetical protein
MVALTLGHWGGIISQLLLDFRITGGPVGQNAVTKIYSPGRWWQVGRHSLSYQDREALVDISQWLASVVSSGGGSASAVPHSDMQHIGNPAEDFSTTNMHGYRFGRALAKRFPWLS